MSFSPQTSFEQIADLASTNYDSPQDGISTSKVVRELLATAVVSLIVFFAIHHSIENFRVDGDSMQPSLVNGQHLIANKLIYSHLSLNSATVPFLQESREDASFFTFHPPGRGDVVIMAFPKDTSRDIVKRVIGLPGDVIEIDSGQVIRNGENLYEPYVTHSDSRTFAPTEVPEDSYYVLGDNRRVSSDSRTWGFVSDEHIIGRAWLSYWPSDRLEFLHPLW